MKRVRDVEPLTYWSILKAFRDGCAMSTLSESYKLPLSVVEEVIRLASKVASEVRQND